MDKVLLEYTIKRSGMSKREFAKAIGFTESRLWRKLSGKANMTIDEASIIADVLGLSKDTAFDIFLSRKK